LRSLSGCLPRTRNNTLGDDFRIVCEAIDVNDTRQLTDVREGD
jgi:hypothetical protein